MPPPPILNLGDLDTGQVLYDREQIYAVLPQRHEFAQLDAIIHMDLEARTAAAYRDVQTGEWWCRGHMPAKPLFPGVLMVECAAQLAAFTAQLLLPRAGGFIGFGGIDGAKFRDAVEPPARIFFLCRGRDIRPRRIICDAQAFVEDRMVFQASITGLRLSW